MTALEDEAGMKQRNWRIVAPLAAAALLIGGTADAKINKERGNIESTNWNAMQMDIKSPKGRSKTWNVARDCEVKFTDKKDEFPNPKLSDLKAPMYIHFMFEEGSDVIQSIEVVEVGYEPSAGGPGAQQQAVVTNLDMSKGRLEVMLNPGGRKTFEVDPKSELTGVKQGDKVTLLIERRGSQEVVTKITKESGSGALKKITRP
jgi:hypothetical protein